MASRNKKSMFVLFQSVLTYCHWTLITVIDAEEGLSSPFQTSRQLRVSHDRNNDLYTNIKPLVILGRIMLVIPCSKLNCSTYKHLKLSVHTIPLLGSILISIWIFIKVIVELKFLIQFGGKGKLGPMGYVSRSYFFVRSFMEFFMYTYFIRKSDKFYRIFDKWSAVRINLQEDKFMRYLAYILVASVAVPLTVQLCFIADTFNQSSNNSTASLSILEKYFKRVFLSWKDIISYDPTFVIFHTLLYVWTSFSRLLIPPLIIFFSRAVSFQFRKLIEKATDTTQTSEAHFADMRNKGKAFWHDLVKKYRGLILIVRTINTFTSPIVFSWVLLNVYNIALLLFRALSETSVLKIPTYLFTIGFGVDVTIFVVTLIYAAQVNKNAEKILVVLRNCPKEDYYDTEVCRLEQQVAVGPNIGLTGMGCFVITKPFLLKVFSAIFTLEIIMLQSTPVPNYNPSPK